MTQKQKLLRLSAVQFAAWELHMYLDTHPLDSRATMRYKELMSQYQTLLADYEEQYGPVIMPATGNDWLDGPWPWETEKEANK